MKKNKLKILINIIIVPFVILVLISGNYSAANKNFIQIISFNNYLSKLNLATKNNSFLNVTLLSSKKQQVLNPQQEIRLVPGGQPIGVKLHTDGILVVGFCDIETPSGKKISPGASSGIQIGDSIKEINNVKINNTKELGEMINKIKDNEINIKIIRKDDIQIINVKPIYNKESKESKIGLWVRDTAAGVGTLTFYEPLSGKFGALGHPINDMDTGTILKIRDGSIYNAKIISIEKGQKGKPGELRGIFSEEESLGLISKNTTQGIYGTITEDIKNKNRSLSLEVGKQSEIKEGPAKIMTCIDDNNVNEYNIYIEKTFSQNKPSSKSMIIRVTDEELLNKTGGIVQGMSGSPIIQNGKIVGAVTHVFVNRPDMGYGIYIEWMLKEMGNV